MRLGLSRRQDRMANLSWEWDIHQVIAMYVIDLAATQPELDPAKSMRMRFGAGPAKYRVLDSLGRTRQAHQGASQIAIADWTFRDRGVLTAG